MEEHTLLNEDELNKRMSEVFCLVDGDYAYDAYTKNGQLKIEMSEIGGKKDGYRILCFIFEPDMTERPQALDYLMGKRLDFAD